MRTQRRTLTSGKSVSVSNVPTFLVMSIALAVLSMMLGACVPTGVGPGNDNGGMNGGTTDGNDNTPDGAVDGADEAIYRFAVIGDFGDDDDDTRAVSELIKGWSPDLIVTVGDNDYSDGAYRGTFQGLELAVGQYFHEFIGNYQGGEGPGASVNRFFPTPGDHDWGDTCDDAAGLDDYLAYFTLPDDNTGNERYYDFVQGPVHFFSIHSLDGCEPDGVDADSVQAHWVRDAALDSRSTFRVAYFHNPPYSSGARHVDGGVHMRWPWNEWGFDLVLSGDDHVYERIERDGVTYVINGLGGVDRHEFLAQPVEGSLVRFADSHGAMRIDVFDDRLAASFVTVSGSVIDEFTLVPNGGSGPGDGNGASGLDPDAPPVIEGNWVRPGVGDTWQWQLQPDSQGRINTSYDVDVYDVDLFNVSDEVIAELQGAGRTVICYFSAGTFEDFRDDAGEFLSTDLGNPLVDFADERWLDVRSPNVHRIMLDRLDQAVARGCDGVEPDNVDGFANDSGFEFTASDQLAFNRFLANEAHRRDLAVGLKNDLDQIPDLVDYFDFAVNEQCHEFDECDQLMSFIDDGKPGFVAEYLDQFVADSTARSTMCADALDRDLRVLVLPLDLDDSLRFSCDP